MNSANNYIKYLIKQILPPAIISLYNNLRNKKAAQYGWFGNFSSWKDASKQCTGYDSDIILKKVTTSLLKVKNKEAVYERDSVLFDQKIYSWPVLSCLLYVGAGCNNELKVLDFGGSLGSTYFQNKEFLSIAKSLRWNIVEQKQFVDVGKNLFQDQTLKFYYSIEECLKESSCNVMILSSVLQYLEHPFEFIKSVVSYNINYLIIDRTSFTNNQTHKITIQKVPPEIYEASYPCHFFCEQNLLDILVSKYEILAQFDALDKSNIENTYFKGYFLKLRTC